MSEESVFKDITDIEDIQRQQKEDESDITLKGCWAMLVRRGDVGLYVFTPEGNMIIYMTAINKYGSTTCASKMYFDIRLRDWLWLNGWPKKGSA